MSVNEAAAGLAVIAVPKNQRGETFALITTLEVKIDA